MISADNFQEFLAKLTEDFKQSHMLFYGLMGVIDKIELDDNLGVAGCIKFDRDKDKRINILKVQLDPSYGLKHKFTYHDWKFIVAHELLHILMHHPKRYYICKLLYPNIANLSQLFNIAADVANNHLIDEIFDISRAMLVEWKKYCWVETVFHTHEKWKDVESDNSLEYFLDLLITDPDNVTFNSDLDDHGDWMIAESNSGDSESESDGISNEGGLSEKEITETIDDAQRKMIEKLSKDYNISRKDLNKLLGLDGSGGGIFGDGISAAKSKLQKLSNILKEQFNPKASAWNKFFYDARKTVDNDDLDQETWTMPHRRYASYLSASDAMLPTEYSIEDKTKLKLWIFVDTGKYCGRYIDDFKRLLMTIPKDLIDYKLFSFSHLVVPERNFEKLHYTGGGMYLSSVEEYILKNNPNGYVDAVLIITDGVSYGNIIPKHPNRWFFVLTNTGNAKNIPIGASYEFISNIMENKCNLKKKV